MKKQDFDLKKFADRFSHLLDNSEENTHTLAKKLGLTPATISRYANGIMAPKLPTLYAIADIFGVNPVWLFGFEAPKYEEKGNITLPDNIIPIPKMKKIPLLGTIACGEPILAQENIDCDVDIPEGINADFALRCKGDSMIDARILDGDIVYIRQQPTVNNGEIAAVLIGDEATLKRVYISNNTVTLMACNSKYQPFVYTDEQLNDIRILGKAVYFTSVVM